MRAALRHVARLAESSEIASTLRRLVREDAGMELVEWGLLVGLMTAAGLAFQTIDTDVRNTLTDLNDLP